MEDKYIEVGNCIAEYILDNDKELCDYYEFCEENSIDPFEIGDENLKHIYAKAVIFLLASGYDLDFKYKE